MFSLIPSDAKDPQGLMRRKAPNKQTNNRKLSENSYKLKIQVEFCFKWWPSWTPSLIFQPCESNL